MMTERCISKTAKEGAMLMFEDKETSSIQSSDTRARLLIGTFGGR
jgi:hypothetical protein